MASPKQAIKAVSGNRIVQRAKPGPSSDTAVIAVGLTVGIILYDHLGSKKGGGVQTYVSVGLGAVMLIALAETVPEIGVPLSVLLLLVVAVARPSGVDFISRLLKSTESQTSGGGGSPVTVTTTKTGTVQAHGGSGLGLQGAAAPKGG